MVVKVRKQNLLPQAELANATCCSVPVKDAQALAARTFLGSRRSEPSFGPPEAVLSASVLGLYAMFVGDMLSKSDAVKPEEVRRQVQNPLRSFNFCRGATKNWFQRSTSAGPNGGAEQRFSGPPA